MAGGIGKENGMVGAGMRVEGMKGSGILSRKGSMRDGMGGRVGCVRNTLKGRMGEDVQRGKSIGVG